jgi:hypothetical protein
MARKTKKDKEAMDTEEDRKPKTEQFVVLPGPTATRSGKKYGDGAPAKRGQKRKAGEIDTKEEEVPFEFKPPVTTARRRKTVSRPEKTESDKKVVRRPIKKQKKVEEVEEEEEGEELVSEICFINLTF